MPATKSKPRKSSLSLSDQVREAIRESSLSQAAIANATGVSQSAISHFVNGMGLKLPALELLLDYFGFNVERSE